MDKITNKEELFDNIELFLEALELGSAAEKQKSIELIKKSHTFLVVDTDEVMLFVPSTFIGFKENSMLNYDGRLKENETNPVISEIVGSTPKIDKVMDEHFLDFCDEIEINRNDVGISRDYWIIKNI